MFGQTLLRVLCYRLGGIQFVYMILPFDEQVGGEQDGDQASYRAFVEGVVLNSGCAIVAVFAE